MSNLLARKQMHSWWPTHVERFDDGDITVEVCSLCYMIRTATMNREYRQLYMKPVNPYLL